MADIEDILSTLKSSIVQITADAGYPRTVLIGWPSRNQMQEAFQEKGPKSYTLISVFTPAGTDRVMTNYFSTPFMLEMPSADLFIDVAGMGIAGKSVTKRLVDTISTSISFELGSESNGELRSGEVVGIIFKRNQVLTINQDFAHIVDVEGGDTLDSIVADLAVQINAAAAISNAGDPLAGGITGVVATTSGSILILTLDQTAGSIRHDEFVSMRVGAKPKWGVETKRQSRCFQVNIWAPSVKMRALFGGILDSYFGLFLSAGSTGAGSSFNRINLPDGSQGTAFYSGSWLIDKEQTQKDWRRIFQLDIEYPTIQLVEATQIIDATAQMVVLQPPSAVRVGSVEGPLVDTIFGSCVTQGVFEQLERISIAPLDS